MNEPTYTKYGQRQSQWQKYYSVNAVDGVDYFYI